MLRDAPRSPVPGMPTHEAAAARDDPGLLRVRLDTPLPERLHVGRGNALFLYGSAEHERGRIVDLEILVDGAPQPVIAHGMPRSGAPGTASGFWAIAALPGTERSASVDLDAIATLRGGSRTRQALGAIRTDSGAMPDQPGDAGASQPQIAICMATFEPPIDLFRAQVESIRGQTYPNWTCVISDGGSPPDSLTEMSEAIGDDSRFRLSHSGERLGYYDNFERALSLIPASAAYVALADQDDRWYPEKLQVLEAALGPSSPLAYSDMRIVEPGGEVRSETFWTHRANNYTDLGSLLIMNSVTGAASLFRRELLADVLPFPNRLSPHAYHDRWIAAVALALGELTYVDRPLQDYVQHGAAVLGHGAPEPRRRLGDRRGSLDTVWREAHFTDCCQLLLNGRVLALRCGPRMESAKRRSLDRVSSGGVAGRAARLALRSLKPVTRRSRTAGAERRLLRGTLWPTAVRARARRPWRGAPPDASLPPAVRDVLR